ncbi:MAG: glycosyltransferase family 2 protein [Phycisphaerae bacterium]|nr:glycosyltransferase family 2 protein [Phycisphaerae bacterium]
MRASVIVPTFRRAEKLRACLRAIACQTADPGGYEVIVAIDGHEPRTRDAAIAAWRAAGGRPDGLTITEGEQGGPCVARNRAIALASGGLLIFFNDDVIPRPGCIAAHLAAHDSLPVPAIITGDSPWRVQSPDSLFAQLLRETSMVFFHHLMRAADDPRRDWGYRHAWLLNLSIPADAVRAVGGLRPIQRTYGRDDDELAFRLTRELGLPVYFRPEAEVLHDHAMTPREYLRREYELGYGAPAFALGAPGCALDLFRRDVLSPAERADAAELVSRHQSQAAALLPWFVRLAQSPPEPALSAHAAQAHAQRHLPLKRWVWRRGLLDALDGHALRPDDALDCLGHEAVAAA